MKIFISYSRKDQPIAKKIRDKLVEKGFQVIIDDEKMRTGQDIEQFIRASIWESDGTLSLVSAKSLLSAWVTMETIMSTASEKLKDRYFLPCNIDEGFLDRNFAGQALEKIEKELEEIKGLMKVRLDKGLGIEDLQKERTRYLKMKASLPEIIGKFRNSFCVDLTPGHFETGMEKIISDLKTNPQAHRGTASIKARTAGATDEIQRMISSTLDELGKQRLADLSRRLTKLRELLDSFERALDLETEPRRKMHYEEEIKDIKKSIQEVLNEISLLYSDSTKFSS
jgi:menaquinone-dependent protoporphyrinogen IX oxidase